MKTNINLHQGDCLEVLKTLNENSIDSVVTDPPYGINFMGKKWDYNVPNVEVWQEVLRVLKPGGHALVACGTRTQHRMAVNLEDAGFEIRDIVAWVYGSGFPKSQNISKTINKSAGVKFNSKPAKGVGFMNNNDDGYHTTLNQLEQTGEDTEQAKQWQGWGTALKPAMELFTLCRKPLAEKTIAKNVLKYNTGGINIDECRVGSSQDDKEMLKAKSSKNPTNNYNDKDYRKYGKYDKNIATELNTLGRFPANFIHDGSDEVVSKFPDSKTGSITKDNIRTFGDAPFQKSTSKVCTSRSVGDSGSASRYFYCAKASKSERNKGMGKKTNGHPTIKPIKLMKYLCRLITPVDGIVLDPYMGSGSTGIAAKEEGFNFTGIELDKDYFEIAKARINNEEDKNPTLFDT